MWGLMVLGLLSAIIQHPEAVLWLIPCIYSRARNVNQLVGLEDL
jgi:hypothetical protein